MTTGERLKFRRKEIGLSAESVAEQLGVSPATIYRYENGDIEKVPVDSLAVLAKILRTTPAYLMGWESQPTWTESDNPLAEVQASDGQIKAIKRVHELTEISRYRNIYAIAFDEYKSKYKK